jgi:Kef-type K+ transport system membrane component KefB/Trk K+ transport system NAD-binding subunit
MFEEVFIELATVIIVAAIIAGILRLLKQPIIISYIITGIIASPALFHLVKSTEALTTFAHIGIALLLFIVGLNLNPTLLKNVGLVSLMAGVSQVFLSVVLAFPIARLLGFMYMEAFYIALALTFSSTVIVMKLLTDKGEVETLYGRITVGILIIQDILAILTMMIIAALSGGSGGTVYIVATNITKLFALIFIAFLFSKIFLSKVFSFIAKSQEFLFLFSLAWCFLLAAVFSAFGLSIEIGALCAGVLLSLTPYHFEISSKMKHLRDFFIILFFISLGTQMVFSDISKYVFPVIVLTLVVLIGKPLIVMIIMGAMGYTKRNGFLTGLAIAQVSEFSFILIGLGVSLNHVNSSILSIITVVGLLSITASTYLLLYAHRIYPHISGFLSIFERTGDKHDEHKYQTNQKYDIIIFGFNRIGYSLVGSLKKLKKQFTVVDYNPDTIMNLAKDGVSCRYGDASDDELLSELQFETTKMVLTTIPDMEINLILLKQVRSRNKNAIFIAVAYQTEEALRLYDEGASYVIMPHFLGAKHTSALLEDYGLDAQKFFKEKVLHIQHLHERRKIGHEHPQAERHHA